MDNTRGRGRGRGMPRGSGSRGGPGSRSSSSFAFARGSGRGRGRGKAPVQVFAPDVPVQLDTRLDDRELTALVSQFKRLSTTTPGRVLRPGFGKRGAAITLRANFFALKYPKDCVLYDYPIEVTPPVKKEEKRLRKRLFDLFESSQEVAPHLGYIAHDGMQRLIAKIPLPVAFSVSIAFYEEGRARPHPGGKTYVIKLGEPKQLRSADLDRYLQGDDAQYNASDIISAFNLVTSFHADRTGILCGKNRYFFPPDVLKESPFALGDGLEAWKGFFSSVRPVYKSLMVNVNVCMSAFYIPHSKLSDAILEFQRRSRGAGAPRNLDGGVRVTTTHLGYRKKNKLAGFGPHSARKTIFQCDEYGGKISVEQYFQRKYRIKLNHADDMPVVNIGSKKKVVYVPAELCEIEAGQSYNAALSAWQTKQMIKAACKPPYTNAQAISQQGLNILGLRKRASPIPGFGIEISTEFAVVPGRVLSPPKVLYQSGRPKVANGSWNIVGAEFSRPANFTRFAVLVLSDGLEEDFTRASDSALEGVISSIVEKCRNSGMGVDDEPLDIIFIRLRDESDSLRVQAITEAEESIKSLSSNPNMVLVFMSSKDPVIYPGIKKLCDMKLGIATVCMIMEKVRGKSDQYLSNIALKINTKLGGLNHQLHSDSLGWLKNTMLVGMDVTHPTAVGCVKGTPSIAAVVASCDSDFMHYPASLRLQGHRVEMISKVKDMVIERLEEYHKRMNAYPERVVVFRDGVSEGQFNLVLTKELPEIKEAFKSFKRYNPKLTIAICGKRHHTRFYPTKAEDADRTSNTKAGTVVDKGVNAVYDFDFYLQAHAALQGTVRATHYTVIYDENKFSADELQQGINDVSYLWARATRSVSLIPPAYWADRACERGKHYLHGIYPPPKNSRESRMDEVEIDQKAKELWGEGIHENLKGTMFYL
ncbi:Piwi-domain-containing protein [Fomitiporia mediterranea MF3/22]|uniref:Piwi-domain-containing protein n=1 Tax=Fomitiporia mediterranea (strain MF3/22) TaxID=694068 RepID=UPI0004407AC5|nr:Piwi-domain-containing protein [Fomitiporia mediterranea MF3/22]EJD00490.1 Piwi-domain-containing protein [Fomitiporia mediterranea MF3/22]